jgi:hypothetical protein
MIGIAVGTLVGLFVGIVLATMFWVYIMGYAARHGRLFWQNDDGTWEPHDPHPLPYNFLGSVEEPYWMNRPSAPKDGHK